MSLHMTIKLNQHQQAEVKVSAATNICDSYFKSCNLNYNFPLPWFNWVTEVNFWILNPIHNKEFM